MYHVCIIYLVYAYLKDGILKKLMCMTPLLICSELKKKNIYIYDILFIFVVGL